MLAVQQVHWRIPAVMVGSLLAGVLAALGHHFFYQSLNQKPTASAHYTVLGVSYADQQVNIALGTAFAFLVKTAFVFAVSTAYYQVFWKENRKQGHTTVPPNLKNLDVAYSGSTSIVSLFVISTWLKYPLLFLMAATAWTIPIAAILTPSTLSIALQHSARRTVSRHVPQLDFQNLNHLAGMPAIKHPTGPLNYIYDGPSTILKQIASSVMATGAILPITDKLPNASWTLEFSAPSLRCDSVSVVQSLKIQRNIAQFLAQQQQCSSPPTYLSWLSRPDTEPYTYRGNATTLSFADPGLPFKPSYAKTPSPSAFNTTLFLAIMPRMLQKRRVSVNNDVSLICNLNQTFMGNITSDRPLSLGGDNMTVLECHLHNSTYHARFQYINGVQSVYVSVPKIGRQEIPVVSGVRGPRFKANDGNNSSHYECATLYGPTGNNRPGYPTTCTYDERILNQLAYQSIYDAFSQLIIGDITTDKYGTVTETSSLRNSILLNTKELFYLTDRAVHMRSREQGVSDLQTALSRTNQSEIGGLSRLPSKNATQSLPHTLEKLFQYFTISLMSSPLLQPNFGSERNVNVTQYTYQTVYSYAVYRLWLVYGLAIVFTTCAVIVGLVVMVTSNAAYTNDFSTIFRIARAAELNVELDEHDLDGTSPLPPRVGRAGVIIPQGPKEVFLMEYVKNKLSSGSTSKGTHVTTALLAEESVKTPNPDR